MTPLSSLEAGEVGVVQNLAGGRSFVGRAAAMGFTPDTEITMVQNIGRGPLLVFLRDTQIALGRGEAGKIGIRKLVD